MATPDEDIIAIIGSRIELTKRGSRYTGRCPFHKDTIPSLFVNPKTQYFLCFGCRAEGGASEFLRLWKANHESGNA
jgi:DNA primase